MIKVGESIFINNIIGGVLDTKRQFTLVGILISLFVLGTLIFRTNSQKRELKEDLIELSNIKYGLFNVDEWKEILAQILTRKIEEFELTETNRDKLKEKISGFLFNTINRFEDRFHDDNSSSITGFFKSSVAALTGTFKKMKQDIPIFTEDIVNFMDDPANRSELRSFLIIKLNEYADNTFAKMDYTVHDFIIKKYNLPDRHAVLKHTATLNNDLENQERYYKYGLVLISIATALFILLTKSITSIEFIGLTLISFIFLLLGLGLPMIEIDARISEMSLSLLGEVVHFQDQVLYYKSKSILEVIRLMLSQSSIDLLLVGLLVFAFSVLFPMAKLITSFFLVFNNSSKSNKLINILVFKTGKWSMADVMVVAIFMAYIGFAGILTEQLNQLDNLSDTIDVLTTNKSSLQLGFFSFAAFAVLSLMITGKLKQKHAQIKM